MCLFLSVWSGTCLSSAQGNFTSLWPPLSYSFFPRNSQKVQLSLLSPRDLHRRVFVTCCDIFHLFNFLDLFGGFSSYHPFLWLLMGILGSDTTFSSLEKSYLGFTRISSRLSFFSVRDSSVSSTLSLWFVCVWSTGRRSKATDCSWAADCFRDRCLPEDPSSWLWGCSPEACLQGILSARSSAELRFITYRWELSERLWKGELHRVAVCPESPHSE